MKLTLNWFSQKQKLHSVSFPLWQKKGMLADDKIVIETEGDVNTKSKGKNYALRYESRRCYKWQGTSCGNN